MAGVVAAAFVAFVVAIIVLLVLTRRDAEIKDQNAKMDQQNREIKKKQNATIICRTTSSRNRPRRLNSRRRRGRSWTSNA